MAIRTVSTGRQAEGLPPLKKPRVHLSRGTGESSNDPVESSIPGDDDLYTDCYWSSEVPNDEILVVNKSTNRQAEGLPPLKKPRVHLSRGTGESSNDPVESSILGDDDLYTDCYWSSEVPNDEILVVNKSTNPIVWSRLTENEKSLFDDADGAAFDHQVVAQGIAHDVSNWAVVYLFGFGPQAVESVCSCRSRRIFARHECGRSRN